MNELWRALRLRCPHCGQRKMFFRWIRQFAECAACGLKFDRGESDYYIGAYTLNLIIAELIVVGAMVAVIIWEWPDVPWKAMPYALAATAIVGPLVTYPYSKAIWLALDLRFRPPEPKDFVNSVDARAERP
ncbi:MAG TPA: DUF983 domain-containing protein [Longimicrobiales bacterium]